MKSFRHLAAPLRLFHGPDSLDHLGTELDRLKAKRAVIITGATLGRGAFLERIRSAGAHRIAGVYTAVRPNSPVPAVQDAARHLKQLDADAVIALGGGSAIVTARAASILLAEGDNVRDLCTAPDGSGKLVSPKLRAPKLPQIVIPSTPTTAAVKAGSAVLDPQAGERLALFDPATRARAIFLHPDLMASPPRSVVVSAAVNTLALAIEGLLSRSGDPISDAMLMHAVRLLTRKLPISLDSDDVDARSDLMMASILSGQGSDYTWAGIAIPLGHAIGAKYQIDMGLADSIVLPHVLRFNSEVSIAGIHKLADALGLAPSDDRTSVEGVIGAFQSLFSTLKLPPRLRDIGVDHADLRELAEISINDWYMQHNPRKVQHIDELIELLDAAW